MLPTKKNSNDFELQCRVKRKQPLYLKSQLGQNKEQWPFVGKVAGGLRLELLDKREKSIGSFFWSILGRKYFVKHAGQSHKNIIKSRILTNTATVVLRRDLVENTAAFTYIPP